jgi:hypothetical protein
MKGTVKQAFPFAFDGTNFLHLKAGDDFPPAGYSVQDKTFAGLETAGFIEAANGRSTTPVDEDLNRRIIDALDKKLSAASDEELKAIIARRGTPFSGNMVHAVLVAEAKAQMLAELEGNAPIVGVNPNAGVTEQPLAAPGAPTPPSAASAIEQQKVEQETIQQNQAGAGENKATNQFGEPLPATVKNPSSEPEKKALTEAELSKMNKADLEAYAAEQKVDLSNAKTKDDYIEALKPKS